MGTSLSVSPIYTSHVPRTVRLFVTKYRFSSENFEFSKEPYKTVVVQFLRFDCGEIYIIIIYIYSFAIDLLIRNIHSLS